MLPSSNPPSSVDWIVLYCPGRGPFDRRDAARARNVGPFPKLSQDWNSIHTISPLRYLKAL